ncbi:lytic murein transglycosylase [Streptomyces smyrnaeus]|uniref:Lytic murein transglycosylase n=1 Tax=Streptomyces smyrnaeus TaxID=1387713 RepID=A0ABS3XNJ9_9ACTN|nr:lytic transglycosylase domain-containing protein [Streptomyces smyrnaeus]MBO8196984.1 lytic murein transglycosylase [Streptomyces smyrnaeus]
MTQQDGTGARRRGSHTAAGARRGPARPAGTRRVRLRRRTAGTALAALAVAALTASQAPGAVGPKDARKPWNPARTGPPYPAGADDGSYHVELPPLDGVDGTGPDRAASARAKAHSGIPATVLRAYRNAERVVRATDPGCGLRWELLAALGKVESGQARGGDVRADGTTRRPILGPVLDGNGFARIEDSDGGAWDGDGEFDRAVGPMQFIPTTWRGWGADGNGDGREDPHNIHDAALAAGRYLCAGDRDLTSAAQLRAAILSYNRSTAYVRTVLAWFAFYREGTHIVPDGAGVLPSSPGAGSKGNKGNEANNGNRANDGNKERKGGKDGRAGDGRSGPGPGSPGTGNGGATSGPERPGPRPTGSGSPDEDGSGGPGGPSTPPDCPDDTGSPSPGPTGAESPTPTPSPTGSDGPCERDTDLR